MPSAPQGLKITRVSLPVLCGLAFGSGLCALIYQVAWQRELRLIFGTSTAASAAVLAIFMGGLGAGSLYFGSRADRHPRPLILYALLDAAIAACAALTPPLLQLGRVLYVHAGGTARLGLAGGSVARLFIAALVVFPATFLMGGTLPAASRAAETESDTERGRLAIVYGINTLGAVIGGIAATFVLLEILGNRRTIWVACLIELLIATLAMAAARSIPPLPGNPTAGNPSSPPEPRTRASAPWSIFIATGLVGFAFSLMELVWYRMLAPLLGGTVFAFGAILAAALVGIGLGGVIYGKLVAPRIRKASMAGFSILCSSEAFFVLLPYALGDRIATLVLALKPFDLFGFDGYMARWVIVCCIVVVPAAIVSGVQFPWLVAMMGNGERDVGRHVGIAYTFNTAGAVIGALAGGFGLIPRLSAPGCWIFAGVSLALLAFGFAAMSLRHAAVRPVALAALGIIVLTVPLMHARGPTDFWRSSPIGIGRVRMADGSGHNELKKFAHEIRESIVWSRDGVESHVALQDENGYAFIVNGKSDGNAIADADTQVMGGLLGAILQPRATSALVIGLGTGSTAGWLATVPEITRVDVAELEPTILDVARACDAVNRHVLDNPKVHVTVGDARELVLTSGRSYDIVFSEPSNPYRAGISSLFSTDFYGSVLRALNDDGVFLQWVQGYEVDGRTIRDIYAALSAVFPSVETWLTDNGDLILVGSRHPRRYDLKQIARRTAEEPFRSALRLAWNVDGAEGLFSHFVANPDFAKAIAIGNGDEVSTDDQNFIEYGFARSMIGGRPGFDMSQLKEAAHQRGEDVPDVTGSLNEEALAVNRAVLSFLGPGGALPPSPGSPSSDALSSRLAVYRSYQEGDSGPGLRLWHAGQFQPLNLFDEILIGEALAGAGDDDTLKFIDQHLPDRPVEANALRALYFMRRQRPAEAARALETSLADYHVDPWAPATLMIPTFHLAEDLARTDKTEAIRLLDAFQDRFAAGAQEEERQNARYDILKRLGDSSRCQAFAHALEPNEPWRRGFLAWRRDCYAATHDPLAVKAIRDLERFDENTPARFQIDSDETDAPSRPKPPLGDRPAYHG